MVELLLATNVSVENQDTNGKLGPRPYRERYHPGMDALCEGSGWLAGSRSERCLTQSIFVNRDSLLNISVTLQRYGR